MRATFHCAACRTSFLFFSSSLSSLLLFLSSSLHLFFSSSLLFLLLSFFLLISSLFFSSLFVSLQLFFFSLSSSLFPLLLSSSLFSHLFLSSLFSLLLSSLFSLLSSSLFSLRSSPLLLHAQVHFCIALLVRWDSMLRSHLAAMDKSAGDLAACSNTMPGHIGTHRSVLWLTSEGLNRRMSRPIRRARSERISHSCEAPSTSWRPRSCGTPRLLVSQIPSCDRVMDIPRALVPQIRFINRVMDIPRVVCATDSEWIYITRLL